jgi:hypothetical protein
MLALPILKSGRSRGLIRHADGEIGIRTDGIEERQEMWMVRAALQYSMKDSAEIHKG